MHSSVCLYLNKTKLRCFFPWDCSKKVESNLLEEATACSEINLWIIWMFILSTVTVCGFGSLREGGGQVAGRPLTGIETLIGFRCWNRPLRMRQKNKTVIDKDVKCDPHVSFRSCSISRARISVPERSDPCEFVLFCLSWCFFSWCTGCMGWHIYSTA